MILMITISGILAIGQTSQKVRPQKFVIQSADTKISESDLVKSSETVTKRLKNFGIESFDVKSIPGKNCVEVILPDDKNLEFAVKLATKKGVLEFYETLNWQEISSMTDAVKLASLLRTETPVSTAAQLGCTEASSTGRVNEYLKTTGLEKRCRFLWNDLSGNTKCLYAMKADNGKRSLLKGSDIETINVSNDEAGKPASINLRFKQPVVGQWAEITKRNIGRSIAIVLDDRVLVASMLRSVITGGNCQISGKFSEAELKYIVAMGSCGELTTEFTLIK